MGKKSIKKAPKTKEKKNNSNLNQDDLQKEDIQLNIVKLKIKNELYGNYTPNNIKDNCIDNNSNRNIYFEKYKLYMDTEFNSKIISMIIVYFNKSLSCLQYMKKEPNFFRKFIEIIKKNFMNGIDISVFTILIDLVGWYNINNNELWTSLNYLALHSKSIASKKEIVDIILNNYDKINSFFKYGYDKWINDLYSNNFLRKIDFKEINNRFNQLNIPTNTYCKFDFIDYNGAVDKIVKESHPYGKEGFFTKNIDFDFTDTKKINKMENNNKLNYINNYGKILYNNYIPYNQVNNIEQNYLFPIYVYNGPILFTYSYNNIFLSDKHLQSNNIPPFI